MNDPGTLPLRDIHLPAPVSWWPPAPGWWLLLILLLLLVLAAWLLRRRLARRRRSAVYRARATLAELRAAQGEMAPQALVRELSVLLRRLGISLYPRTEVAALTGEAWLAFLDRPLPDAPFSRGPGRILVEAPYKPEADGEQIAPLLALVERWLDAVAGERRGTQ